MQFWDQQTSTYRQTDAVAMGLPVGSLLANHCMAHLENDMFTDVVKSVSSVINAYQAP